MTVFSRKGDNERYAIYEGKRCPGCGYHAINLRTNERTRLGKKGWDIKDFTALWVQDAIRNV